MQRSSSPTWSVYDSVWPLADSASASPPAPFVDGPPDALSLKGCGLVKDALLQHGAQGAVYAAHERETPDGNNRNNSDGGNTDPAAAAVSTRRAVKRLFTQPNDFGHRGIEETVLREATVLRFVNQKQADATCTVSVSRAAAAAGAKPDSVFVFGQDDSIGAIRLYRVVEAPHRELCLVMELCASDLRRLTMERPAVGGAGLLGGGGKGGSARCPHLSTPSVLRYLLRRMLAMVQFLHDDCGVLHRDVKLSNFLILPNGQLRLTDFGSARFLCSSSTTAAANSTGTRAGRVAYSPASTRTTMLYQPPETLMGSQEYGTALDVWGLGVVFAELILQKHLFSVEGELALLSAIWKLLGSATAESAEPSVAAVKPTFDIKFASNVVPAEGADLLRRMLTLAPERRITIHDALRHPFLVFDGALDDDAEGARLWQEKVSLALQKREVNVKVYMPSLSLGANGGDDDNDDDDDDVDLRLPKLAPPNFTLQLF